MIFLEHPAHLEQATQREDEKARNSKAFTGSSKRIPTLALAVFAEQLPEQSSCHQIFGLAMPNEEIDDIMVERSRSEEKLPVS